MLKIAGCLIYYKKEMPGKKKGLSLDEKRAKLLEMFYEKKEVLNLKEVEKFGAKKGITL